VDLRGTIRSLCSGVIRLPVGPMKTWILKRLTVPKFDLEMKVKNGECIHSRRMAELFSIGLDKQTSYHRCILNEIDSIMNRHIVEQKPCTDKAFVAMSNVAMTMVEFFKKEDLSRFSRSMVVATRPGRMKKRYNNVMSNVIGKMLGKAFIKFEKQALDKDTVPRLIQYRSSEYTLSLARYTIVMENFIKTRHLYCFDHNRGFPFVSKGLDAHARAEMLYKMWNCYKRPRAHLIDHSKFDSMVNQFHQMIERYIMVESFKGCKTLDWLYSQQVDNRFITQNGVRYNFPFRRCSGDANTSLGNSLINYCILKSCYPNGVIVVDGDDSVVITEDGDESLFDFSDFGMNTKHESAVVFEHVEFCQSRPVQTPIGWVMCRNPIRAISRMNVRLGPGPNMKDYFWTVGIGEGLCSSYMPIITSMARRFREAGKGGRFRPWELDYRIKVDRFTNKFCYPDNQTRASFAIAWGLCPAEQCVIEERLASMVLLNA